MASVSDSELRETPPVPGSIVGNADEFLRLLGVDDVELDKLGDGRIAVVALPAMLPEIGVVELELVGPAVPKATDE